MKKSIVSLLFFYSLLTAVFFIAGCKKPENIKTSVVKPEVTLTDSRVKAIHLYSDTVYILNTPFNRQAGEQLIIDEGTLIKVLPGYNADGATSGIIINPDATILANGTSKNPIVFTSSASTGSQYANWSGITIRGKAINNARGTTGDTTDNSGYLKYVRIEFGSLTLDAVGSGTVIEDVMVSYTNTIVQDELLSSYNFYGGSFNCRNLISYACGGPADFYITNGYNGKMQNIIAVRHPFFGKTGSYPLNALAGVFIENNSSDPVNTRPYTNPVISNLTVIGPNAQNGSVAAYSNHDINTAALVTTGNARFQIRNSLLLGFPGAAWNLADSLTGIAVPLNESQITHTIFHCTNAASTFYIDPAVYATFTGDDLKEFMLQPALKNQLFLNIADFKLVNPFNYEALDPLPNGNSPVLKGASFDGPYFNDPYFIKVNNLGALGNDNWWQGWVNATPLRTNYNFPN